MSILERGSARGTQRGPLVLVDAGEAAPRAGTTVGLMLRWRVSREAWNACGGLNVRGEAVTSAKASMGGVMGDDVLLEVLVTVPTSALGRASVPASCVRVRARSDAGSEAQDLSGGVWTVPGVVEIVVQPPTGREDFALLHVDCGAWLRATVKLDAATLDRAGEARLLFARTGLLHAMGLPGGRYEPLEAGLVR